MAASAAAHCAARPAAAQAHESLSTSLAVLALSLNLQLSLSLSLPFLVVPIGTAGMPAHTAGEQRWEGEGG